MLLSFFKTPKGRSRVGPDRVEIGQIGHCFEAYRQLMVELYPGWYNINICTIYKYSNINSLKNKIINFKIVLINYYNSL